MDFEKFRGHLDSMERASQQNEKVTQSMKQYLQSVERRVLRREQPGAEEEVRKPVKRREPSKEELFTLALQQRKSQLNKRLSQDFKTIVGFLKDDNQGRPDKQKIDNLVLNIIVCVQVFCSFVRAKLQRQTLIEHVGVHGKL